VVFTTFYNDFFVTEGNDSFQISKAVRYATTKEKELLFDIMYKKGYLYNELKNCIIKKEETKRKFKVGDKIIRSNTLYPILTVTFVNNTVYTVKSNISNEEHDMGVKIVENNYKIATFSPSDLKPFDRLLVKRHNTWQIAHFGYFKNGVVFTEMGQPCNIDVVPYNDETKHLLGTYDDYDGFYKWWNN
jgi:ribosomal protein S8